MYSILFDYHPELGIPGTLHKYGSKEQVEKIYHNWVERMEKAGVKNKFDLVIMHDISPEEVKQMLAHTGYVGTWYRRHLVKKNASDVDFSEINK